MDFTTEVGAWTNLKIYVGSDGHVYIYHKETEEGDRVRCRVAGCSIHGIVNAANKTLTITGDHQHDVAGDYLQTTRFRRALKKHISTHDFDVKAVYNRVAADYGPDIKTLVPFAQVKKNFYLAFPHYDNS